MSNIISRIRQVIDYKGLSERQFCKEIGVANGFLSKVIDVGAAKLNKILYAFPEINPTWLLTGVGEMLIITETKSSDKIIATPSTTGIPLIPLDAFAGFGTNNSSQIFDYDCEHYVIPSFKSVDFLISVQGVSMYPKYNNGDIVACKKVSLGTLFQWNKVYVADTEQGILIKRIKKSALKDHILMVSDNPDYDPFDIALTDVYSLAMVVGSISIE